MSFLKTIKQPDFWKNTAKIAIPFFIFVTLISLFFNSGRNIFSGDFEAVNQTNFSEGKWIRFWSTKLIISFLYGVWITYKKMVKS